MADSQSSAAVLEPAVRAVFLASAGVAALLVVAGLVMPVRVEEPDDRGPSPG